MSKAFDEIIVISLDLGLISSPLVLSPLFLQGRIGSGSCATLTKMDKSLGSVGMLKALPTYVICVGHLLSFSKSRSHLVVPNP